MYTILIMILGLINYNPTDSQLEKILAKHCESINTSSLEQIKSLEMNGTVHFYLNQNSFENQSPGLSGTFQEVIQKPDKRYYQSRFNNVEGSFQKGRFKRTSWSIDGGGLKVHQLTDEALLSSQIKFDITPNLNNLEERGFTAVFLGRKEIEGLNYHCIELKHEHGIQFYYIDLETYLVKCIIFQHDTFEKQYWTKIFFDDYRKMNESLFPYSRYEKVYNGANITTMHFQYTNIRANISIDPSIFKIPTNP